MTLAFACSHCQKPLQVKEEFAGKKVKCPSCQGVIAVPAPVPTAAGSAAPTPPAAPKPVAPKAANGTPAPPAPPKPGPPRVETPADKGTNGAKIVPPPRPAPAPAAPPAVTKPAEAPRPVPPASRPPAALKTTAPINPPAVKPPEAPKPAPPLAAVKPPPPPAPKPPEAAKPSVKLPEPPKPAAEAPSAPKPVPPKPAVPPAAAASAAPTAKAGDIKKALDALKATMRNPAAASSAPPGTPKKPVPPKPPAPKEKKPAESNGKSTPPLDGAADKPVDADEMIARMLIDQEKAPVEEEVDEGKPIKHKCFFCEEEGEYPAALGGKQAPCVGCHKIIKIPMPVVTKKKDWRDIAKIPSGARRDIETLDAAWGTDNKATVGKVALLEAGAIPKRPIKQALGRRIKRWVAITATAAAVLGLVLYVWNLRTRRQREGAIDRAIALLQKDRKEKKLIPNEVAAEACRGAAEYYLRQAQEGDRDRSREYFKQANSYLLTATPGSLERDIGFMELVIAEVDLGGNADEARDRKRLKGSDLRELMKPSLGKIAYNEVRADTARRLARKLVAKGSASAEREALAHEAEALVSLMDAREYKPELIARVGLELFFAGEKEAAGKVADNALGLYKGSGEKPLVSPTLVALLVALGREKQAEELAPRPTGEAGNFSAEARTGYALAYALQDNWKDARGLAFTEQGGEAVDRMQALLALAEIAAVKKPDEVAPIIGDAQKLARAPRVTPWMQYLLVRLGSPVGKAKEMGDFARVVFAGKQYQALLNRALLATLSGDLVTRGSQPALEEMQAEADKKEQAYPPALALLARHNARYAGDSTRGLVEKWEPETIRPLGLVGVALGLQDRGQDMPKETAGKSK